MSSKQFEAQARTTITKAILREMSHFKVTTEDVYLKLEPNLEKKVPEEATYFMLDIPPNPQLLGKTVIPVTFYSETAILSKKQLFIVCDVKSNFLKTVKLLPKASSIATSDVTVVYESVYGKPIKSLTQFSDIDGRETLSTLTAGTYLSSSMLKAVPLIRQGSIVQAHFKKDNIELNLKVQALEEGFKGQTIRVKATFDKGKILLGEVVDSNNVSIISTF